MPKGIFERKYRDLTGARFGRWTVKTQDSPNGSEKRRHWLSICDCGNTGVIDGRELANGRSQSCGCLQKELARIRQTRPDGLPPSDWEIYRAELRTWAAMIQRCENEDNTGYSRYGGRGIEVCRRWACGEGEKSGFQCFMTDMGPKPSPKHSIDRINNDGNYEPGNVRWTTHDVQVRNQSRNRKITIRGCEMTMTDACAKYGIAYRTVTFRLKKGWDLDRALTEPPDPRYQSRLK